jgi:hypothetical protein
MPISNKEKIKRLMGQVVGASAGVAVIVTAAATSVQVEASFLSVTVFQDRAFYQLEVSENIIYSSEDSESDIVIELDLVRLRVQNQWDDFSIPLVYGFNEGFIEPLRANQNYTLSIEIQRPIGWAVLETFLFNTQPKTVAIIEDITYITQPTLETMDISVSMLVQQGNESIDRFFLRVLGSEIDTTVDISTGQQTIEILNLPHTNEVLSFQIYSDLANETKLLTSRDKRTPPYILSQLSLTFTDLTTLKVMYDLDYQSLPQTSYGLRVIEGNTASTYFPLLDNELSINNLITNQPYLLEWYMTYLMDDQIQEVIIDQRPVLPIIEPLYVLDIVEINGNQRVTLTIDNDLNYDQIFIEYVFNSQTVILPFTLLLPGAVTSIYELTTPFIFASQSTISIVIIQPPPNNYPIYLQSFTFQGGN